MNVYRRCQEEQNSTPIWNAVEGSLVSIPVVDLSLSRYLQQSQTEVHSTFQQGFASLSTQQGQHQRLSHAYQTRTTAIVTVTQQHFGKVEMDPNNFGGRCSPFRGPRYQLNSLPSSSAGVPQNQTVNNGANVFNVHFGQSGRYDVSLGGALSGMGDLTLGSSSSPEYNQQANGGMATGFNGNVPVRTSAMCPVSHGPFVADGAASIARGLPPVAPAAVQDAGMFANGYGHGIGMIHYRPPPGFENMMLIPRANLYRMPLGSGIQAFGNSNIVPFTPIAYFHGFPCHPRGEIILNSQGSYGTDYNDEDQQQGYGAQSSQNQQQLYGSQISQNQVQLFGSQNSQNQEQLFGSQNSQNQEQLFGSQNQEQLFGSQNQEQLFGSPNSQNQEQLFASQNSQNQEQLFASQNSQNHMPCIPPSPSNYQFYGSQNSENHNNVVQFRNHPDHY